jgi:hypothetical protein
LRRWYDAVGVERLVVLRSEDLFERPTAAVEALASLGLSPHGTPFPSTNEAPRAGPEELEVLEELRQHFAPYNEDLFALLGRRLWA